MLWNRFFNSSFCYWFYFKSEPIRFYARKIAKKEFNPCLFEQAFFDIHLSNCLSNVSECLSSCSFCFGSKSRPFWNTDHFVVWLRTRKMENFQQSFGFDAASMMPKWPHRNHLHIGKLIVDKKQKHEKSWSLLHSFCYQQIILDVLLIVSLQVIL